MYVYCYVSHDFILIVRLARIVGDASLALFWIIFTLDKVSNTVAKSSAKTRLDANIISFI